MKSGETELIEKAKQYLSGAPLEAKANPDLAGFSGKIGFLCSACAARISARGMGLLNSCGATMPVWSDQEHPSCGVCGN